MGIFEVSAGEGRRGRHGAHHPGELVRDGAGRGWQGAWQEADVRPEHRAVPLVYDGRGGGLHLPSGGGELGHARGVQQGRDGDDEEQA